MSTTYEQFFKIRATSLPFTFPPVARFSNRYIEFNKYHLDHWTDTASDR